VKNLVERIKESEGFSSDVYDDSLGYPTIGFGTKLPLSKDEAQLILEHRLDKKIKDLITHYPFVEYLPVKIQEVLYEMAYQLGVSGLLKFKKMWSALKSADYKKASAEMLDSRWAKQTPNRAKRLADIVFNERK
jgi:lysozyme